MNLLRPLKHNGRANAIGCGIYGEDACNYNTAANGNMLVSHPESSAYENNTTGALTVGIVMPSSREFDVMVTSIPAGTIKPVQGIRPLNLTAVSGTYTARTLSWTSTANVYYLIKMYSVDAPVATTTVTAGANDGTFAYINSAETTLAKTVTSKGVTSFIFKAADTSATLVMGAGFSASSADATPTFTVHAITPWALGQLNILY